MSLRLPTTSSRPNPGSRRRLRRTRTAMLGAATISLALVTACGTAQTSLTDEDAVDFGPTTCPSGELKGAGSTAQHNAIDQVAATYMKICDERSSIRYDAASNTDGISAFLDGTADWAGTEVPLTDAQQTAAKDRCTAGEALSLPLVATSVAVVANLPGVEQLTLSGPVLGQILQGQITRWNDPALAGLNPGVDLPDAPIRVLAREDANGLTAGLTRYLTDHDAWPTDKVGEEWTGSGEKLGRAGVLSALRGTPHTLGYVEFSAARDNGLSVARIDSGAGPVALTEDSAAKGLADAELTNTDGHVRLTPRTADVAAGAYPIQIVSYQVVCTNGLSPRAKTVLLKDFLGFLASDPQQATLGELGYTPLPEPARAAVRDAIARVG